SPRQRGRYRAAGPRQPFQRLLHHQAQWHGDGAVDLPLDHRSPWWTDMGHPQLRRGCDVSLHAAIVPGGCLVTGGAPQPDSAEPIVFVIDDDASLRNALSNLFRSVGLRVEVFGSAPEFLQSKLTDAPSCLVLDIRLPGPSGLDFQTELANANI